MGVPLADNSESESLKQAGRLKPPGGPHLLHSVCVAVTGGTFIKYILVKCGGFLEHWSAAASGDDHIVQSERKTDTETVTDESKQQCYKTVPEWKN